MMVAVLGGGFSVEVGISTASYFNRMLIEDTVRDIGAHGVRLAELFLNTFSEYDPAFTELLAARLAESGVTAYSVHPMSTQFEPQLFSIHPRQRADAMRLFERVLQAGRRLGARCYVMHGAATLSGAAKNLEIERIAPVFADLSDMAADYGLALALENVSYCVFCSPEYGLLLRERTGDRLHYTLDVKQAVRSGHDPLRYIEAVGDRLVNVHLCDYEKVGEGRFRWRMPGQGACDFAALRQALCAHGYAGPAFLEVYSDMYAGIDDLYACLAFCAAQLGAPTAGGTAR